MDPGALPIAVRMRIYDWSIDDTMDDDSRTVSQ